MVQWCELEPLCCYVSLYIEAQWLWRWLCIWPGSLVCVAFFGCLKKMSVSVTGVQHVVCGETWKIRKDLNQNDAIFVPYVYVIFSKISTLYKKFLIVKYLHISWFVVTSICQICNISDFFSCAENITWVETLVWRAP